jgi:flagellar biosynthesis/type III secretory pathway protein FliH
LFRIERNSVKIAPGGAIIRTVGGIETSADSIAPPSEAPVAEAAPLPSPEELRAEALTLARQELRQEAEAVLQDARVAAAGILDDARRDAEAEGLKLRGEAWQAGHAEGMLAGQAEMHQVGQALADDVETLVRGLEDGRAAFYAAAESEVIALTLAVAQKVIGSAVATEGELFKSMITNALGQMKREGELTIRLCPADSERLFPSGVAEFTLGDTRITCRVSRDPRLGAGDCTLESGAEQVGAGVSAQMAAITLAFQRAAEA